MAHEPTEQSPDTDLWELVRQGSAPAFEVVVRRHQSLVCAVAYNACGDLTLSEDVAQETFWLAWRERASLGEPQRLRAWLCGIARNVGMNARRRETRRTAAVPLTTAAEPAGSTADPSDQLVTREEESLVWQALERIPPVYREPLILFYREDQSVAEVAAALELNEDAVKQRLSRGRGLLREQLASVVEGALRRSRPGRAFTVMVMTSLTAASAGAKTALAGTGAASGAAGAVLKGAGGIGLSSGLLGSLLGLAGAWFGTWLPAQLAPSRPEREYRRRAGRRMLLISVGFTAVLLGGVWTVMGQVSVMIWVAFWVAWTVAYWAYLAVEAIHMTRAVKRIRAQPAAETNDAPLRVAVTALTARYRGRVFRSRTAFCGLPLIDVNVSDPLPAATNHRRVARGWIAVGDDARGVLLAVGSTAWGGVAIGGRAVGLVSFGGVAIGMIALGGLAVGGLALGGLGIGWQAWGGAAVAWDLACGGGALAWRAGFGGVAVAREYAVGGAAWAAHVNDEPAKALLLDHPLVRGFQWYTAHSAWATPVLLLCLLLVCVAPLPLMYRRERDEPRDPATSSETS